MKYLITNNSNDYEILNDETEIFLPKESRVLDKPINLSTLPSVFTVKLIKTITPDSLGNSTSSNEEVSTEESNDEVQNTTSEELPLSTEEEESQEDKMLMYLSTFSKEDLKKILVAKGDQNCTARTEWRIAQYIRNTYPDLSDEEIKSILGE